MEIAGDPFTNLLAKRGRRTLVRPLVQASEAQAIEHHARLRGQRRHIEVYEQSFIGEVRHLVGGHMSGLERHGHQSLVHRGRAAHGMMPVHIAIHLVFGEQQRLERRQSLLVYTDHARRALGRLHDHQGIEQPVDIDLAVRHSAHRGITLQIFDLVEIERTRDQALQRFVAATGDQCEDFFGGRFAQGATQHAGNRSGRDQRIRHLLVMGNADLLERM